MFPSTPPGSDRFIKLSDVKPPWRTQGPAFILPSFIAEASAEKIYNYLNGGENSMPADWWSYSFHAPFATLRDTSANAVEIAKNKKASLEEFLANRISYRFRRTTSDHYTTCPCAVCETTVLFESDALLDQVSNVLGYEVDLNTSFASCYAGLDFLSPHTDKGNGDVAFVWNLTRNWKPHFGGALHLLTKDWSGVEEVFIPDFNTLTMFEVAGEGLPHFVGHVAPGVQERRLAYSGWFKRLSDGEKRTAGEKRRASAPVAVDLTSPMKHFFQDLSGTFMFPEFYTWLIEKEARAVHAQFKRPMRFAEIGVYKGQSAAYFGVEAMLKLPKEMWPEMHLVDLGLFGHGGSIKQNLTPITDLVRLEWDASSVDVAKKYDDAYFDVVFIDADHGYESVKADIAAWLPKVIAGGIIAGHDFAFQHPGVMQAVQEAFPEFNVIRGRKWDEQKWKTVEEDESGSYIPVWWIRTKRVAPTTRTAALKVLATPHETFPDLQALTAGISRANPLYAADLVRLKERSQAYDGGFGTNVPLLAAVLAVAPPGDVLELGAGNFSTPLMSEMCRAMQRRLVTVDSNLDWITRFGDITDETRIVNGATLSWDEASKGRWAVALVDMAAGCDRAAAIEFLRHRADFIVVHDTHNNYFAGVDAVLATFVHRYDYTSLCPTTTVVSETLNYP